MIERIPAAADCVEPGLNVLEGYSPKDGRAQGSLDVKLYACTEHRDAVLAWVQEQGMTPHVLGGRANGYRPCGYLVNFRRVTRAVEELSLFPMPLRLTVNDKMVLRGTLPEIGHEVAGLVTSWLATDPEALAQDAQTVNLAFTTGAVGEAIEQRGEWYTLFGVHSTYQPTMRVKVTKEA